MRKTFRQTDRLAHSTYRLTLCLTIYVGKRIGFASMWYEFLLVPLTGFRDRLGSRSSYAPQILRDWRRPAQCYPRLLFLPHRLASRQKTPGPQAKGQGTGPQRFVCRPHSSVPKEVSYLCCSVNLANQSYYRMSGVVNKVNLLLAYVYMLVIVLV